MERIGKVLPPLAYVLGEFIFYYWIQCIYGTVCNKDRDMCLEDYVYR